MVRDAVLDQNGINWSRVTLGEEIPTVIDIVVSGAAAENISWSRRQLAGETVRILSQRAVEVVEGVTVQNQIVRRPFLPGRGGGKTSELQPRVLVRVDDALLNDVAVAGDVDSVVRRVPHSQTFDVPEMTVDLQTAGVAPTGDVRFAREIQDWFFRCPERCTVSVDTLSQAVVCPTIRASNRQL